jgi:hypothetical protein
MTSVAKPERGNPEADWWGGWSFPPEEPQPLFQLAEKLWSH